jgi:hypothetical protein
MLSKYSFVMPETVFKGLQELKCFFVSFTFTMSFETLGQ